MLKISSRWMHWHYLAGSCWGRTTWRPFKLLFIMIPVKSSPTKNMYSTLTDLRIFRMIDWLTNKHQIIRSLNKFQITQSVYSLLVPLFFTANVLLHFPCLQILFDGSDVAGEPTELFYIVSPELGIGAYSAPLAGGHSQSKEGMMFTLRIPVFPT